MYADVVMGVDHEVFEEILEDEKDTSVMNSTPMSRRRVARDDRPLQGDVEEELGIPFPQDPHQQLWGAIGAVFQLDECARHHLPQLHDIPASWGTAVNVQAMVFGNLGDHVRHRRGLHPQSIDRREGTLRRVSRQRAGRGRGRRHPHAAIDHRKLRASRPADRPSLERLMPDAFAEFLAICDRLENHYRDMQDMEFTIEAGKLWMLQTRSGKRTTKAAIKIAVDMAGEGLITSRGSGHAARPGLARPAAAPHHRSACRPRHHRRGTSGLARCCHRRDRVHLEEPLRSRAGGPQGAFWCGWKPARKTFTACTPPKAF
jgi:pyruvate,orthophosphate dikinase